MFNVSKHGARERTLVLGPMGAGKSTRLSDCIVKAGMQYCRKPRDRDLSIEDIKDVFENQVMVVKFDEEIGFDQNRRGTLKCREGDYKLHSGMKCPIHAYLFISAQEVILHENFDRARLVVVDEGQFFADLPLIFKACIRSGKDLVVGGLDKDVKMVPFGSITESIGFATNIVKLSSRCELCDMPSRHTVLRTERTSAGSKRDPLLSPGGFEKYMPVCDDCLVEHADEIGLDL